MMARCCLVRCLYLYTDPAYDSILANPMDGGAGVGLQSMGSHDRVTEPAFELRLVLTGLLL